MNAALALSGIALVILAKLSSGTWLSLVTDCPMHMIFVLYCPLCGGTRALGSLLRGEILNSLIYNPAVLPSLIAFIAYDILALRAILRNEDKIVYIHKSVWIPILVLVTLNFIVRNALLLIWDIDYIAAMIF